MPDMEDFKKKLFKKNMLSHRFFCVPLTIPNIKFKGFNLKCHCQKAL